MERYIDAEKVVDVMRDAYWDENIQSAKDDPCVIDAMIDWSIRQVKDAPTEDVAPVVHAHWIKGGDGMWDDGRLHVMTCSNCKALFRYHGKKSNVNYCYKCGAKMDEKEGKQ